MQRLFLAYKSKASNSSKTISRNFGRKCDSFKKLSQKFLISQILGSSKGQGILEKESLNIFTHKYQKNKPTRTEQVFKTL